MDLKQELINAEWRGWRITVRWTNTGDVYTASRPSEVPITADTEEELVRAIIARDHHEGRLPGWPGRNRRVEYS